MGTVASAVPWTRTTRLKSSSAAPERGYERVGVLRREEPPVAGTQQHGRPRPHAVDQQFQSDGGAPRRRDEDVRLASASFCTQHTGPARPAPRHDSSRTARGTRFRRTGSRATYPWPERTSPSLARASALKAFGPPRGRGRGGCDTPLLARTRRRAGARRGRP